MNDYLATTPFDLYELNLFHLVVKHRSFTRAAAMAGLTQSAITRQIKGMEDSLGLELLERTTRSVHATAAGEFLYQESARLLGDVGYTLQRLREDYAGARKEISVGVSRTIALSYLPGFFHANLRRTPEISCRLTHQPSGEILNALETNALDLGVLCPPRRLPRTFRVTHQFEDAFTLIAPAKVAHELGQTTPTKKALGEWVLRQNWLLIGEDSNTGQALRTWMKKQGWQVNPIMQLDNFDLIINLVSLGMGVSFVPIRALALYGQKHSIQRIYLKTRFRRQLVVVVRKHRKLPPHLTRFVENVLF